MHTIDFIRNVLLPNSVIDVGCGVGTWLRAWNEFDSSIRVFGIDGNNMDDSMFFISRDNYQQVNLTNDYQKILESLNGNETYKSYSMRGGILSLLR